MHALINYMYLYKDLAIRFLCMSAIDEPHDTLNQAIENKIKETQENLPQNVANKIDLHIAPTLHAPHRKFTKKHK